MHAPPAMPAPHLTDDGRTVTLDLHGTPVETAERLVRRLVREAHRRGRSSLQIIHGASTSSPLFRNRTIKHAVYALVEQPDLQAFIADVWRTESVLLLGLNLAQEQDPRPLRLSDLER